MPTRRNARTAAPTHAAGAGRMRITKHDGDCPLQVVKDQLIQHMGPCAELPLTITEGAVPEVSTPEVVESTPRAVRPAAQRKPAQRPGVQRPATQRPATRQPEPVAAMNTEINGAYIADVDFIAIKQELYCHHVSANYANLWTNERAAAKYGDAVLSMTGALHRDASEIAEGDFVDQWIVPQGSKITVDGVPVN